MKKRMNWPVTALLASAGVLASVVIAQENSDSAPAVENNAPSVNGIPGESINEGGKFAPIKLDNYVSDDMDKPAQLKWSVSGNKSIKANLHITHSRSQRDSTYNNTRLNAINNFVATLADGSKTRYVDVNVIFDDSNKAFGAAYTTDDFHPMPKYYKQWTQWLAEVT